MKISFVTPTYNRSELLVETIESILESINYISDLDYELVIVDDASSDNTQSIIKDRYYKLINSGMMIYHHLDSNVGVTGAKNVGVEIATGDWIVFIDSDDLIIGSTFLEALNIIKELSHYDVVFFSCVDFYGNLVGNKFNSHELCISEYLKHGTYGEKLPVIKRSVIRQYPYNVELRGFESTAYVQMLLAGKRIWLSDYALRHYRIDNSDRLSSLRGRFHRSALLSSGYSFLIDCLSRCGVKVPIEFRVKKYTYFLLSLFKR
ncbi:glycosyltransferase family 2 protein [Vibrio cholerae]|uniref:glycosyltransferase family 2 protein n=1 Tax=Vibrio cholerae TaxID=666 RepID=UPI000BA90636|nr:glycosyltransferase family 2 protein [Vibrio cholerae]PAR94691.1 hypothetical protein CGT82_06615 [Vibrio cholerae]